MLQYPELEQQADDHVDESWSSSHHDDEDDYDEE